MLQFITDAPDVATTVSQALNAVEGGCRWVQIRMKGATDDEVVEAARRVVPEAHRKGATVVIDDRVHLVSTAGVDGVHIGKEDMPPAEARAILGPDAIIGVTVNTLEDVLSVDHSIINYMGMGPFRFTTTKKKLAATLGTEGYRRILGEARRRGITTPVVAIGGITLEDLPELMRTGITGVAISGAIGRAADPVEATRRFMKQLKLNYMEDKLIIGGREFTSRLFVGTGKFASPDMMLEAIKASESQMITVAMKRVNMMNEATDDMLTHINREHVQLLPNTSGVRDASEAVLAAQMSREIFGTNFIKLEIHPDPKYLMPDPVETLKATEELAKDGFTVLPYIQADPVLCKRLEEVGAAAVMPLGAPIGTNKGLRTADFLEIIIEQSQVPVVVDAGLGIPSHAAAAMEMGADAVLVNTAIAVADSPVEMAEAFRLAVIAGRKGFLAGPGAVSSHANATSPLTSFLNE